MKRATHTSICSTCFSFLSNNSTLPSLTCLPYFGSYYLKRVSISMNITNVYHLLPLYRYLEMVSRVLVTPYCDLITIIGISVYLAFVMIHIERDKIAV